MKSANVFALHDRAWRDNWYVYPVISRRSRGLSIGINLNPDKACVLDNILHAGRRDPVVIQTMLM